MQGKHIFLAVSGLSPQVITEALYALLMQGKQVDEIHVITTVQGRDMIHAQLLASGQGAFHQFLEEYKIEKDRIDFSPSNIHVLKDENGLPLNDLRTIEENDALIAKCMELAWLFTKEPENTVYFLIAGGRKTMSACLALAAQYYGRDHDRIYHVLVTPEFESSRDFFYPPKEPKTIKLKAPDGSIYYKSTKYAEISLVPMPFVSVRSLLTSEDLDSPRSPEELLTRLVCEPPEELTVNIQDMKIVFCRRELDLPPSKFAIYASLAIKRAQCGCQDVCDGCFLSINEILEDVERKRLFTLLAQRCPTITHANRTDSKLSDENIRSYISTTNRTIMRAFGHELGARLIIQAVGPHGDRRYGIALTPKRIKILGYFELH